MRSSSVILVPLINGTAERQIPPSSIRGATEGLYGRSFRNSKVEIRNSQDTLLPLAEDEFPIFEFRFSASHRQPAIGNPHCDPVPLSPCSRGATRRSFHDGQRNAGEG